MSRKKNLTGWRSELRDFQARFCLMDYETEDSVLDLEF